jgi:hypothetical protein
VGEKPGVKASGAAEVMLGVVVGVVKVENVYVSGHAVS